MEEGDKSLATGQSFSGFMSTARKRIKELCNLTVTNCKSFTLLFCAVDLLVQTNFAFAVKILPSDTVCSGAHIRQLCGKFYFCHITIN